MPVLECSVCVKVAVVGVPIASISSQAEGGDDFDVCLLSLYFGHTIAMLRMFLKML